MIHRNCGAILWLAYIGVLCAAEAPVGSLVSPGPVTVRGVEFSAPGVLSWPVLSGDELAATQTPALLVLRNRTRVYLSRNSRLKVDRTDGQLTVHWLQGEIACVLGPGASSYVRVLDERATDGKSKAAIGSGPPAFAWDAEALMQRLTWTWGVYLP